MTDASAGWKIRVEASFFTKYQAKSAAKRFDGFR